MYNCFADILGLNTIDMNIQHLIVRNMERPGGQGGRWVVTCPQYHCIVYSPTCNRWAGQAKQSTQSI